ncbi:MULTISPECIES: LysR family transcriptional regulator [Glutamicibacter]|uniref:LysR family transcriptional regulator n=1 Tax=Glutamicibacter halophytocola TaxID=1933880 RepID=A0A5B8IW43_9MICC|nr:MULTISPECIES: LysR family transcriptional regulator [Glutamicibacter]MBF6670735.1 LysR family transcriptional regulator [Glutamicibacter sp. FBE19]QDY66367.1 LysR family transcriptional regulator [Glutamicibacter halophytocola]UUX58467.1 LysR family transcriptional regulator [Glutamicibacter halophytocola]
MDSDSPAGQSMSHWLQFSSLELLVGIADHGSLSAGARAAGMAQSNASRALKTLERRLGYALVTRKTSGSTLTAEGVLTVQWAREALAGLNAFSAGVRSLAEHGNKELEFGASMTVAEYLAPSWIGQLHEKLPSVIPRMRIMNSHDVIQAVEQEQIGFGFVETPQLPPSLRSREVFRDEMLVVVSPAHPWAGRKDPVTLDELQQTALIEREEGSGTRAFLNSLSTVERAKPIAEFNSNATICQLVAGGMGPAVLSQLAVENQLKQGALVEVPFAGPALMRELRAIWREERALNANERMLLGIAIIQSPSA